MSAKEQEKEKELEVEETEREAQEQPVTESPTAEPDKYAELNDRYLRLMAEYDNFKKRTQKEKSDIYVSAAADVIEAMLPVVDTVRRAVDLDGGNEGLRLISKQLEDALKAVGVEELGAVGEQFDPELHNAVMHIEDASVDGNTVVEEFAKGYRYQGRVIRHSMVKVAN
ncbi:MAG: nucleotide exchange factor GrpE [Clostridiales bacterium]|jgi:molecular chaperone GrpE|nr:nucleotide exchange factor GrpE [Clostridiales bacterium]